MKLIVMKNFWDKITGEPRKAGDIINVSKDRAAELLKHKLELVAVVEEPVNDDLEKVSTVKETNKKSVKNKEI